jgi:regulator of chromosome condensation (RCC1) repeat-containing protein
VDTDGRAWGWGLNPDGVLCLGSHEQHDSPVQLPFSNVTALAGGANHAVYDANGVLVTSAASVISSTAVNVVVGCTSSHG